MVHLAPTQPAPSYMSYYTRGVHIHYVYTEADVQRTHSTVLDPKETTPPY